MHSPAFIRCCYSHQCEQITLTLPTFPPVFQSWAKAAHAGKKKNMFSSLRRSRLIAWILSGRLKPDKAWPALWVKRYCHLRTNKHTNTHTYTHKHRVIRGNKSLPLCTARATKFWPSFGKIEQWTESITWQKTYVYFIFSNFVRLSAV